MTSRAERFVASASSSRSASAEELDRAERELGQRLPVDLRKLLESSDGLEGAIGDRSYLRIWSTSDLVELNAAYEVAEFAPGLLLFGTDGADTAFAFDTRDPSTPIVSVPFIGMDLEAVERRASSLEEFLERLE